MSNFEGKKIGNHFNITEIVGPNKRRDPDINELIGVLIGYP